MPAEKIKEISLKIKKKIIWLLGVVNFLILIIFIFLMEVKYPNIIRDSLGKGDYRFLYLPLLMPIILFYALKKAEFRLAFVFFSIVVLIGLFFILFILK